MAIWTLLVILAGIYAVCGVIALGTPDYHPSPSWRFWTGVVLLLASIVLLISSVWVNQNTHADAVQRITAEQHGDSWTLLYHAENLACGARP